METILTPLPPHQLDTYIKNTELLYTYSSYSVFFFRGNQHQKLMDEVGRLRELTFRFNGSGTGKQVDIDERDTEEPTYRQMVVYNNDKQMIVAGCRIFLPIMEDSQYHHNQEYVATTELFDFSDTFINDYLPHTMDVGRTFIIKEYQTKISTQSRLRSPLELIWKGFGQLVQRYDVRYFLGRVVIYEKPDSDIRIKLYQFLATHFLDNTLITPKTTLDNLEHNQDYFSKSNHYLDDYKKLAQLSKEQQKSISPLIRAYMNLSSTMKFFGSALDPELGNVEEMCLLITIKDIEKRKLQRFM